MIYQSKWTQHTEAFNVRQAKLHEAEAHDDAVKDVPASLEVIVRIQSDDLKHHLCCEDSRENLANTHRQKNRNSDIQTQW